MNVKFKEQIIKLKEDSTFETFRREILKEQNLFIKKFYYDDKPINERLLIKNYDKFTCEMDPNEFNEYNPGKFRCKNCRKCLKSCGWKCGHTETCKAQYKFKIKTYNKFENAEVEYLENEEEDEKDDEKKDEKKDDEIIDKVMNKTLERKRKRNEKQRNQYLSIINKIIAPKQ